MIVFRVLNIVLGVLGFFIYIKRIERKKDY